MSMPGAAPPRVFALADIAATPWKNGGGLTREIAVWPPGAGMDDFDWRVSVADIAADGPFSAFPGIDRQIVLLSGAGVRLCADDGSFDHALTDAGEPFAFCGETGVQATLVDGATRDFNVMTRRGRCRARLVPRRGPFALDGGPQAVLLLAVAGRWLAAGEDGAAPQASTAAFELAAGSGWLLAGDSRSGRLALRPDPADPAQAPGVPLCLQLTMEPEPETES